MKINDIQPFLLEGIKFGQKEISNILSRSDDFNVGIEYEFIPTEEQKDKLEDWLKEYGIGNITKIESEHDNMIEVITDKVSVTDALNHLSNMFKLISDKEIEVPSMAGLHISISTNKYNLSDINMGKFIVLINAEYLHGLFPERDYVKSISDIMLNNVHIGFDKFTKEVVKDIEEQIESVLVDKYQTIKISDYTTVDMSGRIELRFFGGKDYHKQLDTIKQELLRSLFILEIAYTDLHQKQYYRELYDLLLSSEKKLIKQVLNNPERIRDIKNPSEKLQLAMVKENGNAIRFINNPSEEVQLAAVKQIGSAIEFIENPSEEVQLAAVNQVGLAIADIDNPSEEVQLAAVNQDVLAINTIIKKGIEPSEEVQLAAVKQIDSAIEFIENPSEEVQLAAVNVYGHAILYIDNPTEKVQLAAVKKNTKSLEYILYKGIEPSEEVQLAAVREDGGAIEFIENPSEEVQLAAVNQDGLAIADIDNPSEEVQLAAVKKNTKSLEYILYKGIEPSEEVQLAAVNQGSEAIEFIENPSEKVKALHKELWG